MGFESDSGIEDGWWVLLLDRLESGDRVGKLCEEAFRCGVLSSTGGNRAGAWELGRRIPDGDAVCKDSEMSVAMSLDLQSWSRGCPEPNLARSQPLDERHGTSAVGAGPQGWRVIRLLAVFHASRFVRRSEQAEAHR